MNSELYKKNEVLISSIVYGCENRIYDATGCKVQLVPKESSITNSVDDVINGVIVKFCEAWDVQKEQVLSTSQKRELVQMRFIIYHFIRTKYKAITLDDIAKVFGKNDHSTIINGVNKVIDYMACNDAYFNLFFNKIKHFYD